MPAQPALPTRYAWADVHMLAKPLAIKEYKAAWEAVLYRVQGKIRLYRVVQILNVFGQKPHGEVYDKLELFPGTVHHGKGLV